MKRTAIGLALGVLIFASSSIDVGAGGNITAPKFYFQDQEDNLFSNKYEITESDIDLMAATVYYEANTEDMEGKRLVVSVILNRMESEQFPNDVRSVISQKGQFVTYKYSQYMSDTDIPIDCYGAVLAELDDRTDTEVLFFSSEGYNGNQSLYQHGNHYFSK